MSFSDKSKIYYKLTKHNKHNKTQKMPKKQKTKQPISVDNECPVCIDTMVSPCKLPCGHIFCYECLDTILDMKPRCPMCRQDIKVNDYKLEVDTKLYNILLK